jgi:hypothetical protein
METNIQFKDSLFVTLFENETVLRELYNALAGTNFGPETPVTINTLQDVLFKGSYNDISFTIGNRLVVLIEHQSTINENMPMRMLLYIARIYEEQIDSKLLYKQKLLRLPRPDFIMLYNGLAPCPERKILRLSDAFLKVPEMAGVSDARGIAYALDLTVSVYNINQGMNRGLAKKCKTLDNYEVFVAKVREHHARLGDDKEQLQPAMIAAIRDCIAQGIMPDILKKLSVEVNHMKLPIEWNWDDAREVWREEEREEGREEGRQVGIQEGRQVGIQEGRQEGRQEGEVLGVLRAIELIKSGMNPDDVLRMYPTEAIPV